MTEIVTTKTVMASAKVTVNLLKETYKTRQNARVESFFQCVELRYEFMTDEDKANFDKLVYSDIGTEILASYADAITQTSSDRVRMAVALLYCKDSDFHFSIPEELAFISGTLGITDHMIDFYLVAVSQDKTTSNYPYETSTISAKKLDELSIPDMDGEIACLYVNELIRRGLLLPEPKADSTVLFQNDSWGVSFGTSKRIIKMSRLLLKASELIDK